MLRPERPNLSLLVFETIRSIAEDEPDPPLFDANQEASALKSIYKRLNAVQFTPYKHNGCSGYYEHRATQDAMQREVMLSTGTGLAKAVRNVGCTRHQFVGPTTCHPIKDEDLQHLNWTCVVQQREQGNEYENASLEGNQLRIGLYESLRQKALTQPSGVDWAVAANRDTRPFRSYRCAYADERQSHSECNQLSAAFITKNVLMKAVKSRGNKLTVDDRSVNIYSSSVLLLGLPTDGISELSWCAWLLSFLSYPQVQVYEDFEMLETGMADRKHCKFRRTETLVSIPSKISLVLFVECANSTSGPEIDSLLKKLTLSGPDEHIVSQNITREVQSMCIRLLKGDSDMRLLFNLYISNMLRGMSINTRISSCKPWDEIMDKCSLLMWRWHPQPEASLLENGDRYMHNCPSHVVNTYNEDLPQKQHFIAGHHHSQFPYNGSAAVSAADTAFKDRKTAQKAPIFCTGRWTNRSQLRLHVRWPFETIAKTKGELAAEKCDIAGTVQKNELWRRGTEDLKRSRGYIEHYIAPEKDVPLNTDAISDLWSYWLAESRLSWLVNTIGSQHRATGTGIRTGLYLWRNSTINGEYRSEISIEDHGYRFRTEQQNECFVNRQPRPDGRLNDMLMRVNWVTLSQHCFYTPNHMEHGRIPGGVSCRLSNTADHYIWQLAGWRVKHENPICYSECVKTPDICIGWGVNSKLRSRGNKDEWNSLVLTHQPRRVVDHQIFGENSWTMVQNVKQSKSSLQSLVGSAFSWYKYFFDK